MGRNKRERERAAALLGVRSAAGRAEQAEAVPSAEELGAEDGFAFTWDGGLALSSVYLFDSYAEASAAEARLARERAGRGTVNGTLLVWVTGDDGLADELVGAFAGRE